MNGKKRNFVPEYNIFCLSPKVSKKVTVYLFMKKGINAINKK